MKKITLTNDQLNNIFEVAKSARSTDMVRPLMQYAKATVRGKELTGKINGAEVEILVLPVRCTD